MDRADLTQNPAAGISLIEVLIASFVITVALMAVGLTMTQGLSATFVSQEQLIAKQKAREVLESVFTARSTTDLQFTDLEAKAKGGIFVPGWQALREMGPDGVPLTDDDASEPIEAIYLAGLDGVLGTFDDEARPLTNFQRRVEFTPVLLASGTVDEDVRMITVDVRFETRGRWSTVSVSSYISRFA